MGESQAGPRNLRRAIYREPREWKADSINSDAVFAPGLQNLHQHAHERGRRLSELQPAILPQAPTPRRPRLQESDPNRRARIIDGAHTSGKGQDCAGQVEAVGAAEAVVDIDAEIQSVYRGCKQAGGDEQAQARRQGG